MILARPSAVDLAEPLLSDVNVLEQIVQGGLIAWAIIGLSVVLVALAIARLLSIRYSTQGPEELFLEVEEQARTGQLNRALPTLGSDPSALAAVLETVLRTRDLPRREALQQVQDVAAEQLVRLRQQTSYIGLIAAIAPMLGLLGTVSGMIRAFDTMSTAETAPDHGQLAGAIGEALITTYLGLTVAIPALVVHTFLRNRATNIILRITAYAEQLIEVVRRPPAPARQGGPRAASGPHR
ncbi:MAG: MotA/TolQ/ExbB proton channel family protein [Planctomycetota bacterium]